MNAMAMQKLGSAAQGVAAMIEAVGIHAYVDSQRAELPCALIFAAAVRPDRLDADTYEVDWDIYLVTGDHGPTEALDDLGDMLTALAPVLPIEEAVPAVVALASHHDREFPALQFKFTTEITPEEG